MGSVLSGDISSDSLNQDGSAEYQKMDEGTFTALAQTVDSLMTSSSSDGQSKDASTEDIALAVTDQLFNEGVNRLAGNMMAGVEDSSVKTFEFDNFKMEVQKKTKQEFAQVGENKISLKTDSNEQDLLVNIPFDPIFEEAEDIIFASSFSSATGS